VTSLGGHSILFLEVKYLKRFFLFFLMLGLFISVPVFADDFTLQELGLYDSTVDLPPIPVPPDDFPYYIVSYYQPGQPDGGVWYIHFFDIVDGICLESGSVDFDSSDNNYFNIHGDARSRRFQFYQLIDSEWVYVHTRNFSNTNYYAHALNYTNFDLVGGDHTIIANPMMGEVSRILQSHLPHLLQTIMMAGSAVLSKALLILAILLVIGLIPRFIRSWAH
jgi:hypothetical protein